MLGFLALIFYLVPLALPFVIIKILFFKKASWKKTYLFLPVGITALCIVLGFACELTGGKLGSNGASCFGSSDIGGFIFVAFHIVIFALIPLWIFLPFIFIALKAFMKLLQKMSGV